MCPPNAEHSSGQRHSDHTCKIGASDIHACQPLALCKSLMKGAKKRYSFMGYVCSPISSMQPNLLPVFIWLWQYVWSASGYSPLFSTNNFIIECHPFGACWLECRRDCQAAFFCGRRKVYTTIQKGHFLNEPFGGKWSKMFDSQAAILGTNLWPYGPKKGAFTKRKGGFLLHDSAPKAVDSPK